MDKDRLTPERRDVLSAISSLHCFAEHDRGGVQIVRAWHGTTMARYQRRPREREEGQKRKEKRERGGERK